MRHDSRITALFTSLTAGLIILAACASGTPGAAQPQSIVVKPDSAVLMPFGTQSFTADVAGVGDTSVTWKVSEGAAGGAISQNGTYTAPGTPGAYHIVVTSTADPTKSAVVTVTVTTPSGGIATSHGFTISSAHPRIWWNPTRLAQAKAYLAAHPITPASCDNNNVGGCYDVAWKHVVAGASCSAAISWALNNQITCAAPSNIGCDTARAYGETTALIYDWCFDEMTALQRAELLMNVGGSGMGWNDYLAGLNQQPWGGPAMTQNNYNWGNIRNDLSFGIASITENQASAAASLADGITTRWENAFVPSVPTCNAGGVGVEGAAYGSSLIPLFTQFLTMRDGGRDILNETGFFKQYIYWLIYSTTPGPTYSSATGTTQYQVSPFADDEHFIDGGTLRIRSYYQDAMNIASNVWSGIPLGGYARTWWNTVGAHVATKATTYRSLAYDESPTATAYSHLPLDLYATGVRYLYGRKAWDTSSTFFHWQLGHSVECNGDGHGHFDVGNFHVWRGGRWLTRESTAYGESFINGYGGNTSDGDCANSFFAGKCSTGIMAHNGIVWGAPLAPSGTWKPRTPTIFNGDAIVRRLESAAGYTYADVDLTNRYLWDAGHSNLNTGAVVHVERELLFLRDLETTVVLDRLTTGNPTSGDDLDKTAVQVVTTFLLHAETTPTLEDASHITITNGSQALRVTTLVPSAPTRRVIPEGGPVGQYRVEVDASGAAQRYFLHVLQARDAGAANLTASLVDSTPADPTTGTFTVTLHPSTGADTMIVFNKGSASTGGTVNLAGAGVMALRSDVQGITYTDAGPVWGP